MTSEEFDAALRAVGRTQRDVALALGVSEPTVSRWVRATDVAPSIVALLAVWQGRRLTSLTVEELASVDGLLEGAVGPLAAAEGYEVSVAGLGGDLVTWGLVASYNEGYALVDDWTSSDEGREALAGAAALGGSLAVRVLCARWLGGGA